MVMGLSLREDNIRLEEGPLTYPIWGDVWSIPLKDRQQVITAVLPQWQLNALCEVALYLLWFYHMS